MGKSWGLRAVVAAIAAVVALLTLAGPTQAAGGDAARCTRGGWTELTRSDGSTFANQKACVTYAAQGGEFGGPGNDGSTDT